MSRRRNQVDAIRLGGRAARDAGRDAVLRLDGLAEPTAESRSAIAADDWRALLSAAGFDADEVRYLLASRLERVPRRALSGFLGWDDRQVEAVRVRVQRKLARLRTKPASPAVCRAALEKAYGGSFHETLPSGRRVWSFRFRDPFPLKCSKTQFLGPISIMGTILPISENSDQQLDQERSEAFARQQRICDWLELADLNLAKARGDRAKLDKAGPDGGELASAMYDGKAPPPTLKVDAKKAEQMTAADRTVAQAENDVRAATEALNRVAGDIARLDGEIDARGYKRYLATVSAPAERLRAAEEEYIAAALAVQSVMATHRIVSADAIFSTVSGDDSLSQSIHRAQLICLYRHALQLASYQQQHGYRAA